MATFVFMYALFCTSVKISLSSWVILGPFSVTVFDEFCVAYVPTYLLCVVMLL